MIQSVEWVGFNKQDFEITWYHWDITLDRCFEFLKIEGVDAFPMETWFLYPFIKRYSKQICIKNIYNRSDG